MANRCFYVVVVLLLLAGPALSLSLPALPTRFRGVSPSKTFGFHAEILSAGLMGAGLQVTAGRQAVGSMQAPASTRQELQQTLRHRRSLRSGIENQLANYVATTASASVVQDLALLGINTTPVLPAPQPTIKEVVGNGTGNGARKLLLRKLRAA